MTDSREEEERPSDKHALDGRARPVTGRRWDPLASFRKTISPTQRMELLKMKVPVLPPEDFMDTAQFKRARAARSRRFLPLAFGLGALVFALLFAALCSWIWSAPPPARELAQPAPTPPAAQTERPLAAAISGDFPPVASAPILTPPAATAEASPRSKVSAAVALPPSIEPSSRSIPRAKPAPTQAKSSTPPVPDPAPSNSLWTKPR